MAVTVGQNDVDTVILTVEVPGIQGPPGPTGDPGPQGDVGPSTNIAIGTVTTANAGDPADAQIVGSSPDQILNLTIPRGLQGPQGDPGPAGQDGAGISISGSVATYSALPTTLTAADSGQGYLVQADGLLYIWDGSAFPPDGSGVAFRGPAGPANTITVGTVSTGLPGSSASADITGTAPNQTLNITIPKGDKGDQGPAGGGVIVGGATDSVLAKSSSTDFDTEWLPSTEAATASTLIKRDNNGRAKVTDPSVASDIATKNYVDAVGTRVTTLETTNASATSAPTASTFMKRDINGRSQVVSPSSSNDIANKTYVDTQVSTKVTAFADPNADRIVFWDDSASAFSPLSVGSGLTIVGTVLASNGASTTQPGIVELADTTETLAGVDTVRAVSPFGLASALPELVEDIVGGFVVGGSNVTVIYDDTNNQLIINSEAGGISSVDYSVLPAGTTVTVWKTGTTWPLRPTSRSDIHVIWKGADPDPAIVSSGTGGLLNNVDTRFVTP